MISLISTLLVFSLQYVGLKAQCTTEDLVFLDDYCGHIRRKLTAKINRETRSLLNTSVGIVYDIGERVVVTDQVTGLYDVCMSRRNSYISDSANFNHDEWSWKLSSCDINDAGKSVATINVYDSLDCTGSTILKTWNFTDGDTRNFTDIPPLDEKDEEYWFWWFEDSSDFTAYGNDTYEEISVSCFSDTDDNGDDLNSCEGDYFKVFRFDWPRASSDDYAGFSSFTDDEMFTLLATEDDRANANQTYMAKDIETQYRVIDTCSLTYSDYNYNEQWCQNVSGEIDVFQRKWSLDKQGCIPINNEDSNNTRFVNGDEKEKDCGFIESGTYKDNDNYNCLVRTICPYYGNVKPANRTLTYDCPTSSPTGAPTEAPISKGAKIISISLIALFVSIMAVFYQ